MKELKISESLYKYFMGLEDEKQKDVAIIQKLLVENKKLKEQLKGAE